MFFSDCEAKAEAKAEAKVMDAPVFEGPYLADILEQPAALRRVWEKLEDIPALREFGSERIILTGMGSSQFALYPLLLRLIECGLPARSVETAELIHYQAALLRGPTLLIVVSQSGRSAEIVSLMKRCGPEVTVVAVTNDATAPLAARADYRLFLHAGPESTVSCKTYVTTLLVLEWLSAVLTGGDLDAKRAELRSASDDAQEYLAGWRDRVEEWRKTSRGIRRIFVTGRGPSLATAQTGGLILKESTHFAAEGISCPALRHGPFESLGPEVLVLICEGDDRTRELNLTLARDVETTGARVVLIPAQSTIMEMLPVQMLTLALAANLGREAGRFERATKVTDVE
jgi:glucosamine--fructose-6-phosphate aminotransferase (isomerizing)